MKTKTSRILAFALALVMMLCAMPFGVLSLSASAATTADNFEYLQYFITANGSKDKNANSYLTTGQKKLSNGETYLARIFFKPATDTFKFYALFSTSTTVNMETAPELNGECKVTIDVTGEDPCKASAVIKPAEYKDSADFSIVVNGEQSTDDTVKKAIQLYFDLAMKLWEEMLETKAKVTMGNVGFILYKAAADIPFVPAIYSPENVSASNVTAGIAFKWKSQTADKFVIYRKVDDGSWEKYYTTADGKATSYTDTKVESGKEYSYSAQAVFGDVISRFDAQGVCTMRLENPVVEAKGSNSGITVSWKAVPGSERYNIYRKSETEGYKKIGGTFGNDSVTYVDKTAKDGVKYAYTTRAVKGTYISSYKGVWARKVGAPVVSICNATDGPMVSWKPVKNATSYKVYRYDGKNYNLVATVKPTATLRYIDKSAKNAANHMCGYAVRAYIGSCYSEDVFVSIQRLTSPEFTVKKADGAVTLSWKAVEGADGYRIYRKLNNGSLLMIATVAPGKLSYKDTRVKLVKGNNYKYAVRAYSDQAVSSYVLK